MERYYGHVPATMRAVVAMLDDEPVGIAGIAREGVLKLFTEFRPVLEGRLSSITVWRGIKAVLKLAEAMDAPIYALAEHAEGARMLKRLGFEEGPGYFVWRS